MAAQQPLRTFSTRLPCSYGGRQCLFSSAKSDLGVPSTFLKRDPSYSSPPLTIIRCVHASSQVYVDLVKGKFVDMVLALEVWRETRRKVQFLVAAKSMKQQVIGFFARMVASSMRHFYHVLSSLKLTVCC